MKPEQIWLRSLHFPSEHINFTVPDRAVIDIPTDILYTVARVLGRLPGAVLTPEANQHTDFFYRFVTGEIANRFHEDGLDEVVPKYTVFNPATRLAYFPAGSKDPDAPQQKLAGNLAMAISDHLGESAEAQTNKERRELAEVLAQTVINYGWRQVTMIPRNPHATELELGDG